jgi:hypothetical protein
VFILRKKNLKDFLFVTIIIFLIFYTIVLKENSKRDEDYKKLDLNLKSYNINYYTVYEEKDSTGQYKVYKLNLMGQQEEFIEKLKKSKFWSKNKFYEYIMMRFYDMVDNDMIEIDREDLYYYRNNEIYAIFDLKDAKIYYFENNIWNKHKDYRDILGVDTQKYNTREIYSVKGGIQNDGLDYYVYEFSKEDGKDIVKGLANNSKWSTNRLDEKILSNFTYNKEVLSIENGYYHYELICRTSDKNKKRNFTEEEATGCEIGVYDTDKNILYYYWLSI